MDIDINRKYAVITGDIIGFKRFCIETRKQTFHVMRECNNRITKTFRGLIVCDIAMFRGDSWQMAVSLPKFSLRAALFVKAFLIAASPTGTIMDTRMAIGIGTIDYIPEKNVLAGDGEAFRISGKSFDRLEKKGNASLVCEFPGHREKAHLNDLAGRAGRIVGALGTVSANTFVEFLEKAGTDPLTRSDQDPTAWNGLKEIITAFEGLFQESGT